MIDPGQIREHMEVVGSDGTHVGTVDKVEGGTSIKLTRKDPLAQGEHHFIPLDWVDTVEQQVRLNKLGADAINEWQDSAS